jgi:sugar/nucleoside kinase (ribokinase family)
LKEQKTPEILCIGNAIVDIFAPANPRVEEKLDLRLPVQHISSGQIPGILETLGDPAMLLREGKGSSGGGASNVAKIAALLGLSSGFIGTVGAQSPDCPDSFALFFKRELIEAGVQPFLSLGTVPTGVCFVITKSDGTQGIAAAPSAALQLSEKIVPDAVIRDAKVVVLDGYVLGRDRLVHHVLNTANRYGTAIALDVGSSAIAAERAGEIARYCQEYPIMLFMNEDESIAFYQALTQDQSPEQEDLDDNGRLIPRMFAFFKKMTENELFPIVVVKQGAHGSLVFAGGIVYPAETLAVIPKEPTGAGDAFCAAFVGAWIRDKPLFECASLGNRVAREVLDVPGTQVRRRKLQSLAKHFLPK